MSEADRQLRWTAGATAQEALSEAMFLAVYGSPALQAAVGVDPKSDAVAHAGRCRRSISAMLAGTDRRAEVADRPRAGSAKRPSAALLYVGTARGMVDERGIEALRQAPSQTDAGARLTLAEFKKLVREQFFMLLLDRGGCARGHSEIVARRHRRAARGLRGDARGAVGERGHHRRARPSA